MNYTEEFYDLMSLISDINEKMRIYVSSMHIKLNMQIKIEYL